MTLAGGPAPPFSPQPNDAKCAPIEDEGLRGKPGLLRCKNIAAPDGHEIAA